MTIKLSLCIPTYNRASLLREALQSIAGQVCHGVEVVVCDNNSSDETGEVVDEFRPLFSNVTYFCWPENMGADRNVLKTIEVANGEYCWLLGDDDQLEAGALNHVFTLLDQGFDLIYLNAMSYDSDMQHRSGPTLSSFECRDADQTLSSLASWITFISSICVKRNEYLKYHEMCLAHIGTGFAHCYPVLNVMRNGKNCIVSETLVKFRAGNTGGYNIFNVFIKEFGKIMDYASEIGFSREITANIKTKNVYIVIVPALIQIKLGKLTLKADRVIYFLSNSGLRRKEKLLLTALAWCPSWVITVLKNLKRLLA